MANRIVKFLALCFLLLIHVQLVSAQQVVEPKGPAEWSQDYKPFQVVGNIYYVGTYDLACYLITTPQGHILINTGLASSADQIRQHVQALGFKMTDIKILLTTQAHHDHVGAMAAIKKMTGAQLFVDEKDAPVLADGGRSDYAFGGKDYSFAPVVADRLLHDGDPIKLGNTTLTLHHHAGHTKGSSSFTLDVKDGTKTYRVAIVNMPSIVIDRKFEEVKEYPTIAADYANTFRALKALKFDLWLSSHASQFNLHQLRKDGDPYRPEIFGDHALYNATVDKLEKVYLEKLAAK